MEEYSRNLISLLIALHFQIGCRCWKTDEAAADYAIEISAAKYLFSAGLDVVH